LIAQPVTREVVTNGTTVSKTPTITGSENFLVDDFSKSIQFNLSIHFNEHFVWLKGFSLPYLCAGYRYTFNSKLTQHKAIADS